MAARAAADSGSNAATTAGAVGGLGSKPPALPRKPPPTHILRARPAAAKGQYVRKLILSSVMGPGIKIDRAQLAA